MNLLCRQDKTFIIISGLLLLIVLVLGGCQGRPSEKTPIHVNPNMDSQPKYLPQSSSEFFLNGAGMRVPVEGTVARGQLNEDTEFWQGIDSVTGEFIAKSPVIPTMENMERGRERFNIYCSICHGQTGDGTGIIIKKGYMVPPSFHTDQIREYPDGKIFDIITNGIRNMPRYADQVPVEDRWMIINYLRALQLSQNAAYTDLPDDVKEKIK
ncbi:MAG: cytochrome c [Candidatus Electryonea clarkiae]|nr:cytochrome c [Candidatus Electryonea clarkiae]MDP8287758.1 cytochrome c [Candidatus Electryonea clarkiae]